MRVNSNMLMGLVLCMVLFGGVAFLTRINKQQHDWAPNDIYSGIGGSSYSTANVSTSSVPNSGVTLSLRSNRSLLSSSRRTASSFSSYAPAYVSPTANGQYPMGAPSYSSRGASALYTTSSATIKSFGGGNTLDPSSFGGAMRNASSPNNYSTSLPSNNLIVSSYALPNIDKDVLQYKSANTNIHSSAPSSMYSSVINSITGEGYNMILGIYNPSIPSYLYDAVKGSDIRDAQKAGVTNSWQDWLYRYGRNFGTQSGDAENGYTYTFDEWALWRAYEEYIKNYWDPMWAQEKPSFEEWKQWFENSHEYKGSFYVFQPIGDIWALLWIAIGYVVISTLRKHVNKKITQQ